MKMKGKEKGRKCEKEEKIELDQKNNKRKGKEIGNKTADKRQLDKKT